MIRKQECRVNQGRGGQIFEAWTAAVGRIWRDSLYSSTVMMCPLMNHHWPIVASDKDVDCL